MAMVCVMLLSTAGQLCIAELLWDSILGGSPGPLLFPIGPAEGTPVKLLRTKRASFCRKSPPSGFPPRQQKQNVLGRTAFWSFRVDISLPSALVHKAWICQWCSAKPCLPDLTWQPGHRAGGDASGVEVPLVSRDIESFQIWKAAQREMK